jgi:hypothetical protein
MKLIKEAKDNKKPFKYKKLEEYSWTVKVFWEHILDLENTKILGYKEHTIEINIKLQKEAEEKALKEKKEEPKS